ncbi:3-oxoacyl-ACP synthase [Vibrio sp. UCD-FRSSP16_10]|uniref:beta-ketoacyl synthase chain length factor n=1 Tax=unclassified Vibrio TaxID=2614977 RepID=UPI00080199D6|nr:MULTISPECIES: beta-ketoacyl synthase chain length factor [unclassified Vibrio]OBT14818.1 3-oxoacyl-ACP synthase [Vibrio sp. UCD-FRSSP16_30]OBT20106.1 3-oxoacyl-ACP synthase [Vibrio sp. UCD-FRSSP16_10]
MQKSSVNIQFNIDAWNAHSAGISTPEQWQDWAKTDLWPEDAKIETSSIPPMMRRRMSNLSKLAVQTTLELLEEHEVDYLVFSSRHGELHRSVKLIDDIVRGEEASPMAFSQSVHNTAAGLATIAAKKPIPVTSIAASHNTFQSALIEAWSYLQSNPNHKVLVIDFDEPLPDAYTKYENQVYRGYGLGLVLSCGDKFSISKQMTNDTQELPLPQALTFVRHFLSDSLNWTISSPSQQWLWHKKP